MTSPWCAKLMPHPDSRPGGAAHHNPWRSYRSRLPTCDAHVQRRRMRTVGSHQRKSVPAFDHPRDGVRKTGIEERLRGDARANSRIREVIFRKAEFADEERPRRRRTINASALRLPISAIARGIASESVISTKIACSPSDRNARSYSSLTRYQYWFARSTFLPRASPGGSARGGSPAA